MESGDSRLDRYDRAILRTIQRDGRISNVALSAAVHLSPSQCSRRLARLEAAGIVRAVRAQLDPAALGLDVVAFVSVTLERHGATSAEAFHAAVAERPEILECWSVTGDADYLLRVVAPDLRRFSRFLMDQLMTLPGVAQVRSSVALEEIKSTTVLPVEETAAAGYPQSPATR
ncbi:MAG: winged helix-turn-helix transcriptional regulator [Deinococcus-Thermus bacterium]|jgi:Lrp/AsnC family leucine-responsive transcriptional regulator|nr:winged helix-turn-helix transcriptional regulator [Deinococcota bacterium]